MCGETNTKSSLGQHHGKRSKRERNARGESRRKKQQSQGCSRIRSARSWRADTGMNTTAETRQKRRHQTCGQQRHTFQTPQQRPPPHSSLLTTPPHQPPTTIHGHFNPNPSDSVHTLNNFSTILSPIVSESDKNFFLNMDSE